MRLWARPDAQRKFEKEIVESGQLLEFEASLTCKKYHVLVLPGWNFTWPDVMIGVIAHVLVLVVGWFASLLFPAETNLKMEWTFWGWLEKRKTLVREKPFSPMAAGVNP